MLPRRLYNRFMSGLRRPAALYLGLLLAGMGLQIPIPYLLSATVDELTRDGGITLAAPRIVLVLGLSLAGLALGALAQLVGIKLNSQFLLNARMTVFQALQAAPSSFVRRFDVSDLQARVVGDLQSINSLLPTSLANALRHLIFVLVFGAILIGLSPFIVLCVAGFLPLAALLFRALSRRLVALAAEAHAGHAAANATILEALQGLREARVNSTPDFHGQRLGRSLRSSEDRNMRARRHGVMMNASLGLIPIAIAAIIWSAGGHRVNSGEMSIGELLSFMLVLSMLYGPINALFGLASGSAYEFAALRRVEALMAELPGDAGNGAMPGLQAPRPASVTPLPVAVELKGLTFRYGPAVVFEALDALIPAGQLTLLNGPNGTGKSTLAALIAGLDVPDSGCILFEGASRSATDPAGSARPRLGYLSQQGLIFGDTLRANVTMGRDIPDQQILEAASSLGLLDFLAEWPAGLDTPVKEGGRELSGGKRQKIALLRAVVGMPELLILDEPENNLDKATLEKVAAFLKRLKGHCTVVLISHGVVFHALVDRTLVLQPPRTSHEEAMDGDAGPARALALQA